MREDAVASFAESTGFTKVRDTPAGEGPGAMREIVWEISPELYFCYGLDEDTRTAFLMTRGVSADAVTEMAELVGQYFDALSCQDLLDELDRARESADRARALERLGLGASLEYREQVVRAISATLTAEPEIQRAAIRGALLALWRDFLPPLDRVSQQADAEDVRQRAQWVAGYIRENSVES
ncbi:hypothetical protein M8C13_18955 [Crossiella sp. SN42]|uniref:hypothetical protein n=1 Tax=Crossiella sp. SN42 TaxID=2944808 RepID=UPI00207C67B3|nr:hypothetical protein [Crossiella sp. SN42]MCO1577837.1 hypothetical protein [Crossiella sp. SN42]